MNQAKTIHANWVKRHRINKSLLYAAHIDARDNVQLEVEYKTWHFNPRQFTQDPCCSPATRDPRWYKTLPESYIEQHEIKRKLHSYKFLENWHNNQGPC